MSDRGERLVDLSEVVGWQRPPLPPGSAIGILGSGQLGRMLAQAAARLGFNVHIYCPTSGPAFDVSRHTTKAAFDDRAALTVFAERVDVITYEFENVPVDAVRLLAGRKPVAPGLQALSVAQDRLSEKTFLRDLGLPLARFESVDSEAALAAALQTLDAPCLLKTRRFGYDGKGQVALQPGDDVALAWQEMAGHPAVLEQRVSFAQELSVLLVRGRDGGMASYDCPTNTHQDGILRSSVVPGDLPLSVYTQAVAMAEKVATALDYVGVLAVELFYTGGEANGSDAAGDAGPDAGGTPGVPLVINEIAPRVHNSGHWTSEACVVDQFENHMRAIAGWPLGPCGRHSDCEMTNLLGDDVAGWLDLARESEGRLHIYGKREARDGRKMGHITRLKQRT
ncbi:MAG: 5-(carboxyamino)imidazole ribonucleotide synthase [Pseudomonadota bacterium]